MKASLVNFQTPDKLTLPGLLFKAPKSKKAAIYLHGNGSASVLYSVEKMNVLANELCKKGISFLAFNNRGAQLISKVYKEIDGEETRLKVGTSYEIIKECIYDIDGAVEYLKSQGFREFYLIGNSTGANKICVYNYYTRENPISKYILAAGGDDTGILFDLFIKDKKKLYKYLKIAKEKIDNEKGTKFIPKYFLKDYMLSYQSFYDMCHPDGDYNTFPFYEVLFNKKLGKKKIFREYKSIKKQTLVIYGENDEYCYGKVYKIMQLLKKECSAKDKFKFEIIEDTDHGFHGKSEEFSKRVAEWLS